MNINSNKISSNSQYYDFIVVGSGPSGSLVAVNLAKHGYKTLLIEAGPNYIGPNITTPAFHLNADLDPNISWHISTKNYPESSALRQNVLYPRASGLGGCTLHSALIHVYPNKEDFDYLVQITNDTSWNESNMRKYFDEFVGPSHFIRNSLPIRVIDQLVPFLGSYVAELTTTAITRTFANDGGWLPLINFNPFNIASLDLKLLDIIEILIKPIFSRLLTGININSKVFNELVNSQEGSFLLPLNVDPNTLERKGVRELVLNTLKNNTNLHVWTDTLVTKILLDSNNSRAIGVEYKRGRHLYRASPLSRIYSQKNWNNQKFEYIYANKEIIVSGGSFNTPQLMMLSGIGDRNELSQKGIVPKVHIPGIGKNLQDRYEIPLNYRFSSNFSVLEPCKFTDNDECYREYKNYKTGGYTFNGLISGDLTKSNPYLNQSDIFTLLGPVYFTGYNLDAVKNFRSYKNMFTFYILKAHTKNTFGTVKLNTNDPRDMLDIDFNYFSEYANHDLDPMVMAIRKYRKMAHGFPSKLIEVNPGIEYQTDNQLKEYIRRTAWGHHACCTMKIGDFKRDNMAVLDGDFKVKNIRGLRVVDMSVFNKIPGYFPTLFLYMIGAKAADTIAREYNKTNTN